MKILAVWGGKSWENLNRKKSSAVLGGKSWKIVFLKFR